jgi:septum formation protein
MSQSNLELILASASPSRARLLKSVALDFRVQVSGVDEEDPTITALSPREMVIALAILKAHAVADQIQSGKKSLVLACDSTFEFDGESLGKPGTAEIAIARAKKLRGASGLLHTGHCVIDLEQGIEVSDISTARVHFADMSDEEIENYVATGEPLQVAGGFTLDGMSAPFITHIEGDPSGIIGLSLPTLRKILHNLGRKWSELPTTERENEALA